MAMPVTAGLGTPCAAPDTARGVLHPDTARGSCGSMTPTGIRSRASSEHAASSMPGMWHLRWCQEQARSETQLADFERAHKKVMARQEKRSQAIANVIGWLGEWAVAQKAARQYSAWGGVAREAKASERLRRDREAEEKDQVAFQEELAIAKGDVDSRQEQLCSRKQKYRLQEQRQASNRDVIERTWIRRNAGVCLASAFMAWKHLASCFHVARLRSKCLDKALLQGVLLQVWCAWALQVGRSRREDLESAALSELASIPEALQTAASACALSLCSWACSAWSKSERIDVLVSILAAWWRAARKGRTWRGSLHLLLSLGQRDAAQDEALHRAFAAWISVIDDIRVQASVQNGIRRRTALRARIFNAASKAACEDPAPLLAAILVGWQLSVAEDRIQLALGQIEAEQSDGIKTSALVEADLSKVLEKSRAWHKHTGEERSVYTSEIEQHKRKLAEVRDAIDARFKESEVARRNLDLVTIEVQKLERQLQVAESQEVMLLKDLREATEVREEAQTAAADHIATYELRMREAALLSEELQVSNRLEQQGRQTHMKDVLLPAWRSELAEQESHAQEAREAWQSSHSAWATEHRESERVRKRLEQDLSAVQHQVIGMTPRINGFESANDMLRKRLDSRQAQISKFEGSRSIQEIEDLTAAVREMQSKYLELEKEYARRRSKTSPREVLSQSTASSANTVMERSNRDAARAANAGDVVDPAAAAAGSPRQAPAQDTFPPISEVGDDVHNPLSLRDPSTIDAGLSSADAQGAPAETLVTQSRHISLNSRVEELLLDFSIQTGVAKQQPTSSSFMADSPPPAAPPSSPFVGTSASAPSEAPPDRGQFRFPGGSPCSSPSLQVPPLRKGDSRQGSPPHSPGHTARSTASRSGSPRLNRLTPAQAASRWRQRTLSQHDAERQNLQERMEQMRRHIERTGRFVDRPAA